MTLSRHSLGTLAEAKLRNPHRPLAIPVDLTIHEAANICDVSQDTVFTSSVPCSTCHLTMNLGQS